MKDTLARRPKGQPLWLFAYGSLMWNPLIRFEEKQTATLLGWHRSFCIRLCTGRATPITPGRMLGLREGGKCHGIAFKLSEEALEEELTLVWIREMALGLYKPEWTQMLLPTGESVAALAFCADVDHPQYAPPSDLLETAAAISEASGCLGSNVEYFHQVYLELQRRGLSDPGIEELREVLTST